MKLTILSPVNHDGKLLDAGDALDCDAAAGKALIEAGAAEPADVSKAKAKAAAAAEAEAKAAADAEAKAAADAQAALDAATKPAA